MIYIHQKYSDQKKAIEELILDFSNSGTLLVKGSRNTIKTNYLNEEKVSIKFFGTPNFFKSIIYSYFRKSKAKRSFEYANYLLNHDIKTPFPIAYGENKNSLGLIQDSFYICKHIDCDFTIRELIHDPLFPNRDVIMEQFTEFTYKLHEAKVNFLDHSPGNTLVVDKGDSQYDFYLIDLNRMKFETMPIEKRMDNFKKMWLSKKMLKTVAKKYASLAGESEEKLLLLLNTSSQKFKRRINKKKWLKRKIRKK